MIPTLIPFSNKTVRVLMLLFLSKINLPVVIECRKFTIYDTGRRNNFFQKAKNEFDI